MERFEGYCPEHLVLQTDDDGALKVMRMQAETLENLCVLEISGTFDDFDKETIQQLQQGEAFSSLDEINQYLENLDS